MSIPVCPSRLPARSNLHRFAHLGADEDCLKLRLNESRPLNERLMLASSDPGTAQRSMQARIWWAGRTGDGRRAEADPWFMSC